MVKVYPKRECLNCGKPLSYYDFEITSSLSKLLYIFGEELLKTIWLNDIFVLYCCTCYKRKRLYLRHSCPKCGSKTVKLNHLCFNCWSNEKEHYDRTKRDS